MDIKVVFVVSQYCILEATELFSKLLQSLERTYAPIKNFEIEEN